MNFLHLPVTFNPFVKNSSANLTCSSERGWWDNVQDLLIEQLSLDQFYSLYMYQSNYEEQEERNKDHHHVVLREDVKV